MSADIIIRPARKDEARAIAALFRIASEGVSDYVWQRLAEPGEDLLDTGARRYARENTEFSYQNCLIVECGDQIAGMMHAFPMHVAADRALPEDFDPVLRPYAELEADDTLYIAALAVEPGHRGQGIGRRLIGLTERQVREMGLSGLSLLVFENNPGAVRLYRRLGFESADRRAIVPHPLIHHTGDVLLMVKTLTD